MRIAKEYQQVVAIAEKSAGNESVGDMWLETKIFNKDTLLSDVIDWATELDVSGKLIITVPNN